MTNRAVAISISDSPDLAALGLGEQHLRDAMAEVARYLLVTGARLLYGGDLRASGFTELLFELVERHRPNTGDEDMAKVVTNYLPWPVHMSLSADQLASRAELLGPSASLVCLGRDGAVLPPKRRAKLAPKQPSSNDWSRGLTAMRRLMTGLSDARVLLGGRVEAYQGKMPGIAEEALLMIEARKPVFLLGGFGGCARDIAETIGLAQPYQTTRSIAWDGRRRFAGLSADELRNGLTIAENTTLACTVHIDEAIVLLLRGVHRLFHSQQ